MAERRPLGMILKDLGYLSVSQIDEILQTLEDEAESKKKAPMLSRAGQAEGSTERAKNTKTKKTDITDLDSESW